MASRCDKEFLRCDRYVITAREEQAREVTVDLDTQQIMDPGTRIDGRSLPLSLADRLPFSVHQSDICHWVSDRVSFRGGCEPKVRVNNKVGVRCAGS